MILPGSFTSLMKDLLGAEYDDFIASFDEKPLSALRVNTSKVTVSQFEKIAPYPIQKIPFISDGYYIDDTDAWSKHPYYFAGLYYLQEPSAMLPADIFPAEPGDVILDLCAAPGGKATKLATKDIGLLVANDISYSRTLPLVKNLEHFGTGNYLVTASTPENLYDMYGCSFDGILVDAPCSGEGMFRKDRSLIASYEKKGSAEYPDVQKQILENAYKMLKAGGHILYSTCTYSDKENEQVILSFLKAHQDMKTVTVDKGDVFSGAYAGYEDLDVYHLFPHRAKGEGHFIALLKKDGIRQNSSDNIANDDNVAYPAIMDDFFDRLSPDFAEKLKQTDHIIADDGYVYLLCDRAKEYIRPHVRYVRTGTVIGKIRKDSFIPSTAFALSLCSRDFDNVISYDATSPDVIRYLKGETIIPDDNMAQNLKKGLVLICVSSYPLGFGKYDGKKIKNMYEKGWVLT
ncbi:MAG: RsmF rRNA methyltransferase first C-terminal domain-containing protein [Lachnospiraceae bacterium]|nr:RsmF rRNA methyltransferase first C-terminal domain-containing protein [Lachnospiraceae bacterium]